MPVAFVKLHIKAPSFPIKYKNEDAWSDFCTLVIAQYSQLQTTRPGNIRLHFMVSSNLVARPPVVLSAGVLPVTTMEEIACSSVENPLIVTVQGYAIGAPPNLLFTSALPPLLSEIDEVQQQRINEIIASAERYAHHVLLQGVAEDRNEALLVCIAHELQRRGKRVVFVPNPSMMPNNLDWLLQYAWEGHYEDQPLAQQGRPLYLLVNSAEEDNDVLHYLMRMPNRNVIVIAACLHDVSEQAISLFINCIAVDKKRPLPPGKTQ